MTMFLIAVAFIGLTLILGLAFNMIRPGKIEWHQYDADDAEWQSRHQDSWRDSH